MQTWRTRLRNAELRNYLRWRWQHDRLAVLVLPVEWAVILIRAVIDRRLARRSSTSDRPIAPTTAREPVAFFFDLDQLAAVAHKSRALFGDQIQLIVHRADRMCEGYLPLPTNVELPVPASNWQPIVDDIEHLFALNRWAFGVTLAKAWQYTGEARYVARWLELWRDWVRANPPDVNSPVWESYSVSERLIHGCQSLALLWTAPGFQEACPELCDALAQHAAWLVDHLETQQAHNHLINNARALYVYGALFGQTTLQATGWTILERELARQVLPDGLLGEQSTHYHLLLTRTYIEVCLIAQRVDQRAAPEFLDRIRQMISAAAALIRPDGSLPLIGDVSPDTDLQALVGIIGAGQLVLGLARHPILSESAAWYLTGDLLKDWARASTPSLSASHHWPDAGYGLHRTPDFHLVFQADPRAGVIRHGHVDVPGVTLWSRGHDVLIDAGQATYVAGAWSDYFHGPAAHNTLTIDDLPPYIPASRLRRWLRRDYWQASARLSAPYLIDGWWVAEATHTGYRRLAQPVEVQRRVIVAPEYVWITDRVAGEGSHRVEATWHFGANTVQLKDPGQWAVVHADQYLARALWQCNGQPITPTLINGQTTPLIQGWYSTAYGQKQPGTTAIYRGGFARSVRLDLVLMLTGETAPFEIEFNDWNQQIITPEWRDRVIVEPGSRRLNIERLPGRG
jgi:hypothetical protein